MTMNTEVADSTASKYIRETMDTKGTEKKKYPFHNDGQQAEQKRKFMIDMPIYLQSHHPISTSFIDTTIIKISK